MLRAVRSRLLAAVSQRKKSAATAAFVSPQGWSLECTTRALVVAGTCGQYQPSHLPPRHSTPVQAWQLVVHTSASLAPLKWLPAQLPKQEVSLVVGAIPDGGKRTPSGWRLSWPAWLGSQTRYSWLSAEQWRPGRAQKVWSGLQLWTLASSCPLTLRPACRCLCLSDAGAGMMTEGAQDGACIAGTPRLW